MDYMGMLCPIGIPFSGQGIYGERGPFFRLEVCERGTFSGNVM